MAHNQACLLLILSCVVLAQTTLTISNTLGSNMVLQRAPLRAQLWGTADAGATITVTVGSQPAVTTEVDGDGNWLISLPPTAAGGPYDIAITSSAGDKGALQNVLFGDVYICSGQSNMQFTVDSAFNSSYEVERANNYPNIRIFSVGTSTISATPLSELAHFDLGWSVASSTTVGGGNWTYMSAVCWFTGADLYDELQVPLGLISTNWGGTYIQAWSSPDVLSQCDVPIPAFNASGGPNQPGVLYNSMIVPFLPMSINGALWYQGEANVGATALYACMEPAMITDWRAKFGSGDKFPFFFVQLAPWIGDVSYSTLVADIRTAQLSALALPAVGFASAVDLGDATSPFNNIHPRNKQEVGKRLAAAVLNIGYGQTTRVWQGPTFQSASQSILHYTATVDVTFTTYGETGLNYMTAVCPSPVPSNQCANWEVGFSNGVWYPAPNATSSSSSNTVTIEMNVPATDVTITGVRYAYSIWPLTTLFSQEGLPVIPFEYAF